MQLSPDFKYGIFEHPHEGKQWISILHLDGDNRSNILKLLPVSSRNYTDLQNTTQLFSFFTSDNNFLGIKTTPNDYKLFKLNGKLLCTLHSNYCDLALTMGGGGLITAVGIIDKKSRTCAPWSIKALI